MAASNASSERGSATPARHQPASQRSAPAQWIAGLDRADWIACGVSAVWIVVSLIALAAMPRDAAAGAAGAVMTVLAIAMPVALIWVLAISARNARIVRAEARRLAAGVDALHRAYLKQSPARGGEGPLVADAGIAEQLEALAEGQEKLAEALEAIRRAPPPAAPAEAPKPAATTSGKAQRPPASQPPRHRGPARGVSPVREPQQTALALGTPAAPSEPISAADFVLALNFPEDAEDAEGFRALRLALRDRDSSGLVRAAQDVLTLLSEDGIYMDDLSPDRARPEIWRQFADGERGRAIAALGGIRDREALAQAAGRARQDPIFRDATHHFLRKFDHTVSAWTKEASDEEIAALAETRSARAFMLLGRISGTFD
ncbi:hypothetical protein RM543_01405 [Roseicyclus sp. F158]|uniref:Uncharacterized protein n=1 Tax=Tropicimonas omnivorans TaxID=3075590 RepID=A0ABU3DC80_9RHOB|nr:hypothetical protein [Roseicyclus sp. F158]MDT0681324.1 hypothetical protein [Roseicyclus sp. F158]